MATFELAQLVQRERYLRDTEQWSLWRGCYHPDSSQTFINLSWFKGEIDEFVRRSRDIRASGIAPIHTVVPGEIKIDTDSGRGFVVSSCQITSRFSYQEVEFDLVAHLRLVSRVVRVDDQWKMLSLEGIYLQDSIQPVLLCSDVAIRFDLSKIPDLRSSYKCLIWNIERKGMKARRDLPGADDPQSVEEIMRAVNQWFEGSDDVAKSY